MNDITKLPKWAQNEIERLRANCAQMEIEMAMIVGATPTAVEVDPYRVHRGDNVPRLFLPENYSVAFNVGRGRMHVGFREGALTVTGHHPMATRIAILPSHANAIELHFEKEVV